jgi:hypothetical protein
MSAKFNIFSQRKTSKTQQNHKYEDKIAKRIKQK